MTFLERVFRVVPILAVMLSGCSVVRYARETQRGIAPAAQGVRTPAARVDLRGSSLERLVAYAETNRPSVMSARQAVNVARLQLLEVRADAPLVSGSIWSASTVSARGSYDASSSARSGRPSSRTDGLASGALSLDVLVYDFGRNEAETAAASESVIAAEESCIAEGYVVFEEVTKGYFGVLEANALLAVARTNEVECQVHLSQAEERLAAGEAQPLDVTRAKLDLAQALERTVSASNDVATAGAEFMRALGIDAERGSVEDVLPPSDCSDATVRRAFEPSGMTSAEAFRRACVAAPSLAVARARLRASSAAVDAAVADLMPSIAVSASLNWTDPLWVWRWGVDAAQSLFTGLSKQLAVVRAVEELKQKASAVREAEQALSLQVSLAVAERDSSGEACRAAWSSVVAARENLDVVKQRYLEGEASAVDFTDALGACVTAEGNYVTAFYRGQLAEARLFAVLGESPAYHEEKLKKGER